MKSSPFLLAVALFLAPALAAQEDPPSLEAMRALAREKVKEQSAFIKQRVFKALTVFKNSDNLPDRVVAEEHEALVELGLGVLPPLVEGLQKSDSAQVMQEIGKVLVRLVAEKRATVAEVGGPLRDLLDQPDPRRAAAAIGILGWIGDESALDAIRLLTSREEPDVRAAVITALARLGDEGVREHFESGMASKDPAVRVAVMRAAQLVGDARDVSFILAGIADSDIDVALAAIRATAGVSTNSKAMRALHEQLGSENENRIRTAIEVIVKIGNKDYSARHLGSLAENEMRNFELRKLAAMAMYKLGSSDGMDYLARGYEQIIKDRPKDPRNYEQLAQFYEEFGAWSEAAKTFSKAIDNTRQAARQNDLRLSTARCWARAGQFKRAAALLKKTPRGDNWGDLVSDPAFEKMREDRRYRGYFEN